MVPKCYFPSRSGCRGLTSSARHTVSSPQRLKDGVLYVHVLQPTVHFELERMWKKEILDKLKKRFGGRVVREIRFRLG